MPLKYNEVIRPCRVNLTHTELLEIGKQSADDRFKMHQLEDELDGIKKTYKARIEALDTACDLAAEKQKCGYEMRDTLCIWHYDIPTKGKKTLRRADTSEDVTVEIMDGNDSQHVMATIDAEAAQQAVAKATTPDPDAPAQLPTDLPPPTGSAPGVKSKRFREHYTSEAFSTPRCYEFASWLHRVFSVTGDLIAEQIDALLTKNPVEKAEFLAWLEEQPRPGSRLLARALRDRGLKTLAEVPAPDAAPDAAPVADPEPAPAEIPVEPWPEYENTDAFASALFTDDQCAEFAKLLHGIYYIFGTVDTSSENIEEGINDLLEGLPDIGAALFLGWLTERPRPGSAAVIAELRKREIVPAFPEPEKPKRKPRANRSGVVGCDADGDDLSDPDDNKAGQ
ncbi:hypothetical protein OpiT1DRAFT_03867 [Opitutaceae bacterium TAV1]|nr:hypothetical protein OpiT1DRAFT_03867 [Opitutaceae bacterium TAV1]